MSSLAHDAIGWLHLGSSVFALLFGALVLVWKKGSRRHVRFGYLYFTAMVVLLCTSFLIYRLFGGLGIFHYAAMASALVLALGLVPIWLRRPARSWRIMHYNFMYWSVVGLYEALAAELLTRLPNTPVVGTAIAASLGIFAVGVWVFVRRKAQWEREIGITASGGSSPAPREGSGTSASVVLLAALALSHGTALGAQGMAPMQDSTRNNLVHLPGTTTVPHGSIGAVERTGDGPVTMILIPTLGVSGRTLLRLMGPPESSYRFVSVTLAGFGGTAPPAMPEAGTSYADERWIAGAVKGIREQLPDDVSSRAIVLGHGALGSRVALRFAAAFPEVTAGLVLVASEPARPLSPLTDLTAAERRAVVDGPLAQEWFRTVTQTTWDTNMWQPEVYARDKATGEAVWREVAAVPLPTMIRYLSEFLAGDDRPHLATLDTPMLLLRPGFSEPVLSDSTFLNARRLMRDGWTPAELERPNITSHEIADGHLFLMHDQPAEFRRRLESFVTQVMKR